MPGLYDLLLPEWAWNPYPLYRELAESGPVYWDEWMRSWVVLGHQEIVALAKDERLSGARIADFHAQLPPAAQQEMAPLTNVLSDMMLFNEPPRHTRLRRLIKPGLTPRFIRELRPMVEALADDLLDRVADRGEMDIIRDFSEPLSRGVIATLAGLPTRAEHLLVEWRGLLHEFFTQSSAQFPRIAGLRTAFDEGARRRRDGTATDAFSQMIGGQIADGQFSDDEVFANLLLLIDAGQATTTHMIGNAVLALLDHPDQANRLRANPDLLPQAVPELLRYDSSVQFTTRVALSDLTIADRPVTAGQSVTLVLGAGNRDPNRYPEPDRLDITRRANDHLSFGHGVHYCLGAALAVTEIEVSVRRLLDRTQDWQLMVAKPAWLDSINFRFLNELPIRFGSTPAERTAQCIP